MVAPPHFQEGQSTYMPPRFNGQYYGWWKTRMHDFIMAEDFELWDVICDGPFVPTKTSCDPIVTIPKTRKEFNNADRKAIEKNFRAEKSLSVSAKEIWEALQTSHEGTTQVKQSKTSLDMLTTEYKLFRMKDDESIQDMHTRFTSIINELHSLGEIIQRNKIVRKILSVLPSSWESKANAITEDQFKNNTNKEARNPVPNKRFKRKNVADNVVRQALAAWGDSSSESEEENDHGDSSMMKSDDDEDDDDDEVNFLEVQRNLKSYSPKKLMSWANVLIEAYQSLINDKDVLTVELGEAEQTRDDLVVVVVYLKEIIVNLKKEKDALDEKIANIEHERDDLMVVVVDLKETIECVRKEKDVLTERVANIEHERDDLLVVVVDLKEAIGELKMESRHENSQKGKEVASEAHIKLESELNSVKSSLCTELEKNK
ncbi:uncharacterized protein [Nicotiana tomentosiformis]|uniref:uncharacterized protein n=1 Tax=Nicotiana tomentosiformis TaxID=4098 RepID=UPI00388C52A6